MICLYLMRAPEGMTSWMDLEFNSYAVRFNYGYSI